MAEYIVPKEVKHPKLYHECIKIVRENYPTIPQGGQQEVNIAMDVYNTKLRQPKKQEPVKESKK